MKHYILGLGVIVDLVFIVYFFVVLAMGHDGLHRVLWLPILLLAIPLFGCCCVVSGLIDVPDNSIEMFLILQWCGRLPAGGLAFFLLVAYPSPNDSDLFERLLRSLLIAHNVVPCITLGMCCCYQCLCRKDEKFAGRYVSYDSVRVHRPRVVGIIIATD